MRKFFIVLGLLGLLAQPAHAQQYSTGTPVVRPSSVTGGAAAIPACPTTTTTGFATPVQSVSTGWPMVTGGAAALGTACPLPTGGAATVSTTCPVYTGAAAAVGPTVQPVKIPKKHWWNRTRTGYAPVCPGMTGGAAAVCPIAAPTSMSPTGGAASACPSPITTPTGGAAMVCPTGGAAGLQPVLVPKRHFWESDQVQMMQVSPMPTGGAAPIYNVAPVYTNICPSQ